MRRRGQPGSAHSKAGNPRTAHGDGSGASAVAGSHVLVAGEDSIRSGKLAVLLVHVVGAGARVVANPDAEVFDLQGLFLRDLQGQTR